MGGLRRFGWGRTCEDVLEGQLDVASIESGGFDEGQVVLAYMISVPTIPSSSERDGGRGG